jgi:hypothetical protein
LEQLVLQQVMVLQQELVQQQVLQPVQPQVLVLQ